MKFLSWYHRANVGKGRLHSLRASLVGHQSDTWQTSALPTSHATSYYHSVGSSPHSHLNIYFMHCPSSQLWPLKTDPSRNHRFPTSLMSRPALIPTSPSPACLTSTRSPNHPTSLTSNYQTLLHLYSCLLSSAEETAHTTAIRPSPLRPTQTSPPGALPRPAAPSPQTPLAACPPPPPSPSSALPTHSAVSIPLRNTIPTTRRPATQQQCKSQNACGQTAPSPSKATWTTSSTTSTNTTLAYARRNTAASGKGAEERECPTLQATRYEHTCGHIQKRSPSSARCQNATAHSLDQTR